MQNRLPVNFAPATPLPTDRIFDSIPKEWFVMTDPENFKLNATGVPLRESHRRCRVGADGAPEVIEAIQ